MHVFKDFSFLQFYFMHMCCKQATIFLKLFVMIIIFNPIFIFTFLCHNRDSLRHIFYLTIVCNNCNLLSQNCFCHNFVIISTFDIIMIFFITIDLCDNLDFLCHNHDVLFYYSFFTIARTHFSISNSLFQNSPNHLLAWYCSSFHIHNAQQLSKHFIHVSDQLILSQH